MPELPEVETIRKDLEKELVGFYVTDISTTTPTRVFPSIGEIKTKLIGLKISSFKRVGKLLIIEFEKNQWNLVIHLKMSGRLLVGRLTDPNDAWTRTTISLSNNEDAKLLRFTDIRKFGFVKMLTKLELEKLIQPIGPEPLRDLTFERFRSILEKSDRVVKTVLMDQSKIAGVGNIYANEALFRAKIYPEIKASDLTERQTKALFASMEYVLSKGIEMRGASDNTYRDAFGNKGRYQEHFQVYRRDGEACTVCGSKINRMVIGQRGTFYCPRCQKKHGK